MKKSIKTSLICCIAVLFTVCICILIGKIKAKENNAASGAKSGFSFEWFKEKGNLSFPDTLTIKSNDFKIGIIKFLLD